MSRALDLETISSIAASDPLLVYNEIVKGLRTPDKGRLEIEFLGKSHPLPLGCNILRDGNNIGISKVKLVQAFIVARQIFFKSASDCAKETNEDDLWDATAVILLMDPEHITSANARKRLIQNVRVRGLKAEVQAVLKRELRFVDGYLTSRLHRHTKSPTIWGHRRWLLSIFEEINLENDILSDLTSVILIAAERHPRNYYAWSHMRWLLKMKVSNCKLPCSKNMSRTLSPVESSKVIDIVKDWCLRHPSDTSGFSFLLFCISDSGLLCEDGVSSLICSEVLRLTISFKWTHESVWVFLRTLVADGGVGVSERNEFFHAFKTLLIAHPNQTIAKRAEDWYAYYERSHAT
jgi:protein prenyltransferase alpha subunit repeat containing protein 1